MNRPFFETLRFSPDPFQATKVGGLPVAGSSVLAMIMMHELIAQSSQKLADRGIELSLFASPMIEGVTLRDTYIIHSAYRERMIEAQQEHLPQFEKTMAEER